MVFVLHNRTHIVAALQFDVIGLQMPHDKLLFPCWSLRTKSPCLHQFFIWDVYLPKHFSRMQYTQLLLCATAQNFQKDLGSDPQIYIVSERKKVYVIADFIKKNWELNKKHRCMLWTYRNLANIEVKGMLDVFIIPPQSGSELKNNLDYVCLTMCVFLLAAHSHILSTKVIQLLV